MVFMTIICVFILQNYVSNDDIIRNVDTQSSAYNTYTHPCDYISSTSPLGKKCPNVKKQNETITEMRNNI